MSRQDLPPNPRKPEEPELPDNWDVPFGFRSFDKKWVNTDRFELVFARAEDLQRCIGALFGAFACGIVFGLLSWSEQSKIAASLAILGASLFTLLAIRTVLNRVKIALTQQELSYQENTLFSTNVTRFDRKQIERFEPQQDKERIADGRWRVMIRHKDNRTEELTLFDGINDRGHHAAETLCDELNVALARTPLSQGVIAQ